MAEPHPMFWSGCSWFAKWLFWCVHYKYWIQWFNGFWTSDTRKTPEDSDHFIKGKLRPQDGAMGETIRTNSTPNKLERLQLKKKTSSTKRERKREKQRKITGCHIGNRRQPRSSGVFTELMERLHKKKEH